MAIKVAAVDIVECWVYGRNRAIDKMIHLFIPKPWQEHAWHWLAVLRGKSDWIERHTRGPLEHLWTENRRD